MGNHDGHETRAGRPVRHELQPLQLGARSYQAGVRRLPAGTDTRPPAPDELGRFIVIRALNALGIASEKEIREYIRIGDKGLIAGALREMLASAGIVHLNVEGQPGAVYALPAFLEKVSSLRARPPRVRLLSPFDNLVTSRSRKTIRPAEQGIGSGISNWATGSH